MSVNITYSKLESDDKSDIEFLKVCLNIPEIKRFLDTPEQFFDFVTKTENVFYYKILLNNKIIGGLHFQISENVLYPAIWILPTYQRQGIAEKVINDIKKNYFRISYNKIQAGIEKDNTKSLGLFKKLGFKKIDIENKIINVEYSIDK